jgi:6-pyruvoyltetrahydropterin/6-carboxytetrahydropterin synthase
MRYAGGSNMTSTVTVKVFFEAAHRLHNPAQSDEWNRRVFGKCNNPHGHGHNYVIEAAVTGEVDPETGYLIDMKDLKAVLNRLVVSEVDHRHLNIEVDWLSDIIPTAENLAREFFERVAPELPEGVELASITVHETDRNSATYTNS